MIADALLRMLFNKGDIKEDLELLLQLKKKVYTH